MQTTTHVKAGFEREKAFVHGNCPASGAGAFRRSRPFGSGRFNSVAETSKRVEADAEEHPGPENGVLDQVTLESPFAARGSGPTGPNCLMGDRCRPKAPDLMRDVGRQVAMGSS